MRRCWLRLGSESEDAASPPDVNEAVRRQLCRDALAEVLAEMREANGPVSDDAMEEVRRLWPGPDDEVARQPA